MLLSARIKDFVEEFISKDYLPGCSIMINQSNELVYINSFGRRNIKDNLEVNINTIFPIGCITKIVTSMLILALCKKNRINIDKPLRNLFPNNPMFEADMFSYVTIKDIIAHRTGIVDNNLLLYINKNETKNDIISRICNEFTIESFRNKYSYCSTTYVILGELVKLITNRSYEEYVTNTIFKPMNMIKTSFFDYDKFLELTYDNFATPYVKNKHELEEGEIIDTKNYNSSMGIITTIDDLSRLFKELIMRYSKTKYLSEIIKPLGITDSKLIYPEIVYDFYGLGFNISCYKNNQFIYHDGNYPGYSSQITYFPKNKISIAVLTNISNSLFPKILTFYIFDILCNLSETKWKHRLELVDNIINKNNLMDINVNENKNNNLNILRFVGRYYNDACGYIEITNKNFTLYVNIDDKKFMLTHIKGNEFYTNFKYLNTFLLLTFMESNELDKVILRIKIHNEERELLFIKE